MAKIVLGMGTSHGPMLSTPPDGWNLRVPDDLRMQHHYQGRTWTFEDLRAHRQHENLVAQIQPAVWARRHAQCRAAIAEMARVFDGVKADIAVIVGNDQMEIFTDSLVPAFSVLWGDSIINSVYTAERMGKLPPGVGISVPGHIPPGGAVYAALPQLGEHLIRGAIADGYDVAAMKKLPRDETPHAFGFVYRQIMNDRVIPSVPVLVNTFYPPNQPTVQRCLGFGESLMRSIAGWDSDLRVALIASGGLTHFVIDEAVDRVFLDALRSGNMDRVAQLGEATFQAGTSEIKNWMPVASAMAQLGFAPTVVDYVPCYRTEAGTGNAMGFVHWLPKEGAAT